MADQAGERRAGAHRALPVEERAARNEALWREVNDKIEEIGEALEPDSGETLLLFHCECGRSDCGDMLELAPSEYDRVRSQRDRFVVAPGHEQDAIERVVERTDRYLVVDKLAAVEPIVGADGISNSGN